jgi:hypothetical protein
MKQCPNCQKEYDDSKRFCQSDGTLLVDKVENLPVSDDQFKTIVGNQSVVNDDPYKTIVASDLMSKEDDLLQIPEPSVDSLKTMVVSQSDLVEETPKTSEPSIPIPTDVPIFNEPSLAPPNLSEISVKQPKVEEPKPPVVVSEAPTMMAPPMDELPDFNSAPLPSESPFGKSDSSPIPSPFEPTTPKFDLPTIKEEEKFTPPVVANPFDQPFGNQQMEQQSAWNPPPAPEASWQNQQIGQNTPFQPPVVSASGGQEQTLAIVSLVCGILSLCLCGIFTAIPAIITGYMQRNNIANNPNQYGGAGMALAGMILGGVSILFTVIYVIFVVLANLIK